MIDPHVHCRDWRQAYKGTIEHELHVAESQGVNKIFDMPNTNPPILRKKAVEDRLKLVPNDADERYYLYMGITANTRQIEEAVNCYDEFDQVVGIKMYAGKSVGDLAIIELEDQRKVYEMLSEVGYTGVLAIHCEREDLMRHELWNPNKPITHAFARPKSAEIEAVKDQIKFAKETGFKGIVHIVHVSAPESVQIVDQARSKLRITCGVTPHHAMWDMQMLEREDGLIYKMNPPLRSAEDVEAIRNLIKQGKVDWIETDHAPHPIGEKLFPPYMSGFPSLYLYRKFVGEFLPKIGVSKGLIEQMTEGNIKKTFGKV